MKWQPCAAWRLEQTAEAHLLLYAAKGCELTQCSEEKTARILVPSR